MYEKNPYTMTVTPTNLVRAYHRMGAHHSSMSVSPPSGRRFMKRAVSVGAGVVASTLAGARWVGGRNSARRNWPLHGDNHTYLPRVKKIRVPH